MQLPCSTSTCSDTVATKTATVTNGGAASVPWSTLPTFSLLPVEYNITNTSGSFQFCSAGFYASTDEAGADVVVVYDPTVGYTTSGSDNPRVELRQTTISGKNAGWFLNRTSATTLTVTQRIMKLPAVHKSVTVMQIFDTSNGHFVEVQTRVCRGKSYELSAAGAQYGCTAGGLYMVIYWVQRANATDTNNYIFLAPYAVGTQYTLSAAASNAAIVFAYTANGATTVTYTLACPATSCGAYSSRNGLYFKTGACETAQYDALRICIEWAWPVAGAYLQNAYLEANTDYALLYMYSAVVS